jgi:hypothetical protein
MTAEEDARQYFLRVMARLVPAIPILEASGASPREIAGTSPAMTWNYELSRNDPRIGACAVRRLKASA